MEELGNIFRAYIMADKKYNFTKLLKEYNKKYNGKHTLNPGVSHATIVHRLGDSRFNVEFGRDKDDHLLKRSLGDFLYYDVTPALNASDIKSFILHKEEQSLGLKIEIWPPSKVRYAYLDANYYAPGMGNLGKSCMRFKEMQKALNFYVENKIKIVVVVDGNNKIHARALLWDNVRSTRLKNPFTYLDRIYAKSDALLSLFYGLVEENKWKRYPTTSVNNMDSSYYKEGINAIGVCHLPYNDTFRYLHLEKNLLTSGTGSSMVKHLNISGSYVTLNVHNNRAYYPQLDPDRVREAISGNYISKKDAIKIKRYDGYVLKKNIASINGAYYSILDKIIIQTKVDGYILRKNSATEIFTNDVIDKSKAIQSPKYKGYIHKSNAIYIRDEIYHKKDTDVTCFGDKWYHTSQCFINYDREKRNTALSKQKFHPWIKDEVFIPYPDDFVVRKGNLIPKEHAIIAYDLTYNPVLDNIEYQEVYCTKIECLIQLTTGELIVNSAQNKMYLKKFNNKWYIKQDFEAPNKKQLLLFK